MCIYDQVAHYNVGDPIKSGQNASKTFLELMFICQITENCFDNTTGTINEGHGDNILNKGTRVAKIQVILSRDQRVTVPSSNSNKCLKIISERS